MSKDAPVGFWSYTRRDDELDRGRIRRLVDLISGEFEIMTGRELHIFVDKNDIAWGEEWRSRVDTALMSTAFMIAVVTPRFFASQECRREVITFSSHAKSAGLDELLLPIVYSKVPGLLEEETDDEVVSLIKRRNYFDWSDLRLEDEDSPRYRQAVNELASRLADILDRASEVDPVIQGDALAADQEAGIIEQLAEAEEALPRLAKSLTSFGDTTNELAHHMNWAIEQIAESDRMGEGFAGRLRISNELAEKLRSPIQRMSTLGDQYASDLAIVDPGVLTLIRQAQGPDISLEDRETAKELFSAIQEMVDKSRENVPILTEFTSHADDIARMSKVIRPLMKSLKSSVQRIVDGQAILDEWERLIRESDGGE